MPTATKEFLKEIDALAAKRRERIKSTSDNISVIGTRYYVAADGDDRADGKSPDTAWRSLRRVSEAALCPGDGVFFRRGDLFRGCFTAQSGVTYAAFGNGEKPRLFGGERDLADPTLWELYDEGTNIWHLREPIADLGTLVFDGGVQHAYKHIPSYRNGRFVCRADEERAFIITRELTHDLDFFCNFTKKLSTHPTKGEDFPVPDTYGHECPGDLYLRSNRGNPGLVFSSIEPLPHIHGIRVGRCDHVRIDNLCLRYYGMHGISAGGECVHGLHVTNCEIGWIGGCIQTYFGTDPNYPEGRRGSVTRFGNAVEIYGGCDDFLVESCYIYECYDAGITHQVTTFDFTRKMTNILYKDNLIERCVYGIEYFLELRNGVRGSHMDGVTIEENFIRYSGLGWGQQRYNADTPAHIKGWSYENIAHNFTIRNNILDRAGRRSLHLVAERGEYCPLMEKNTYIQYAKGSLGKYGGREAGEPAELCFDEAIEQTVRDVLGDGSATVYTVQK